MKKKITIISLCFFVSMGLLQAQLLFEENFDYDAGRVLIADAVASSDNFDGVTGWATQSNLSAGTNCFDITDAPLLYSGYVTSGIGNALKYNGQAGQGVFKLFEKGIKNDSTVYISFLINFPSDTEITGGDYFLGIKMEPAATSTNWGGRLYAAVNPEFDGEEVSLGINKMSGGTTTWVNPNSGPFFAADRTHLFVIKYHVGVLNGTSEAEEAGNYDDVMSLFVNPPLDGNEPASPTLLHIDATQKDLYRYSSSGKDFGSARGLYLRSSEQGNAPAYIIDGIRVGLKWEDVVPQSSGISENILSSSKLACYITAEKQIVIASLIAEGIEYELYSVDGKKNLSGNLTGNRIDASGLLSGVYILKLENQTAKIILQ